MTNGRQEAESEEGAELGPCFRLMLLVKFCYSAPWRSQGEQVSDGAGGGQRGRGPRGPPHSGRVNTSYTSGESINQSMQVTPRSINK